MSYQAGSAAPEQRAELFAEPRDREARPRFRAVVATAALLVMGIFAGGLWFAYHAGIAARQQWRRAPRGDVPLIRADERPTRVKPEKPGGMEIPDRDKLIYTQKRAAVEHLLPPPEKPMPRPTAPPAPAVQPDAPQPPAAPPAAASGRPRDPRSPPAQPQQSAIKPRRGRTAGGETGGRSTRHPQRRAEPASSSARCAAKMRRARNGIASGGRIRIYSASLTATPIRADLGERGCSTASRQAPIRRCGPALRRAEAAQSRVLHCPMRRRVRSFWAAPARA